jgi:phytoene synthase
MAIRRLKNRRPRLLAPSRILRPTMRQTGGWREREELVEEAGKAIAKGSKSFAVASRLFDRETRERAWLLYAWCRRCDDIADGQEFGFRADDHEDAENLIQAIRVLTRRALDGQPTADPAFDAFGQVAQEVGLTMQMAEDVIGGFELDAQGWQPHTEADLLRYSYHVAGAVGVMMAHVMGVDPADRDTLHRASDLGIAFQLANIARDLVEDARVGRCYIPTAWGTGPGPLEPARLVEVARRLAALAHRYRASSRVGAARLPFRSRWAVLSAAAIYGEVATRAVRLGASAWDRRISISKAEKFALVGRALVQALLPAGTVSREGLWTRPEAS